MLIRDLLDDSEQELRYFRTGDIIQLTAIVGRLHLIIVELVKAHPKLLDIEVSR